MPFLILFAIAGTMASCAPVVFRLAQDGEARDRVKRRQEFEAEILSGELKLAELKDEARRRGLDPDAVIAGYRSLRSGDVTVDDVEALIAQAQSTNAPALARM